MTLAPSMVEPSALTAQRRETRLATANLAFLGAVLVFLLVGVLGTERVQPLVVADPQTNRRIQRLERTLQRDPGQLTSALELAQIYRDAGEFPWSYDALLSAERTGTRESGWRLQLGLAYLEIGRTDDALRVLGETLQRCSRQPCPAPVRVKLELFLRVARILKERHIQPYKQRGAAEEALHEVLKPVRVDPDKMRPKAPVAPLAPSPSQSHPDPRSR